MTASPAQTATTTAAGTLSELVTKLLKLPAAKTQAAEVVRVLQTSLEELSIVMANETAGEDCLNAAIHLNEILSVKSGPSTGLPTDTVWGTGICDGVLEEIDEKTARDNVKRFDTRLFRKNPATGDWETAE